MRLDHVGVAVRDLESALRPYEAIGVRPEAVETVEAEGVKVAFLRVGDAHVELLEPLRAEGAVARFLEKRGEGMHHLAVEVDDIIAAIARAKAAGLAVIDDEPRRGARGRLVAFVHPRSFGGVLLEFVEPKDVTSDQ